VEIDHRQLFEHGRGNDASEGDHDTKDCIGIERVSNPVTDRDLELGCDGFHRGGDQFSPTSTTPVTLGEHESNVVARQYESSEGVRGDRWGAEKDQSDRGRLAS
jgi:hypothetical protein